jgi:predicted HicB family RNase H-like nuclease
MKDVMMYKDYVGSIHYSNDDEILFGKIEGINDSISFEGSSVMELKAAFEESVLDYIELCRLNGKEPEKAYKGSFNIRIKPKLHKQAVKMALIEGKSLNQYIEDVIEEKILK